MASFICNATIRFAVPIWVLFVCQPNVSIPKEKFRSCFTFRYSPIKFLSALNPCDYGISVVLFPRMELAMEAVRNGTVDMLFEEQLLTESVYKNYTPSSPFRFEQMAFIIGPLSLKKPAVDNTFLLLSPLNYITWIATIIVFLLLLALQLLSNGQLKLAIPTLALLGMTQFYSSNLKALLASHNSQPPFKTLEDLVQLFELKKFKLVDGNPSLNDSRYSFLNETADKHLSQRFWSAIRTGAPPLLARGIEICDVLLTRNGYVYMNAPNLILEFAATQCPPALFASAEVIPVNLPFRLVGYLFAPTPFGRQLADLVSQCSEAIVALESHVENQHWARRELMRSAAAVATVELVTFKHLVPVFVLLQMGLAISLIVALVEATVWATLSRRRKLRNSSRLSEF